MSLSADPFYVQIKSELERLQKREERCYGWSASIVESRSLQSLLLGDEKEGFVPYQDRDVEERSYSLQVYARHSEPQKMGQAAITVDPMSPLEEQVRSAWNSSLLVENPLWDLPGPPERGFHHVQTSDPAVANDMEACRKHLLDDAIMGVRKLGGGALRVNSAELYVNRKSRYAETSRGIVMERDSTDLYFEAAMERLPGPGTQEVHRYKKGVRFDEMDLVGFMKSMAEETLSLGETILPVTSESAVILVESEVISDFLNALTDWLDAGNEYNNLPHFLPGDSILAGAAWSDSDPVDLVMDPFLPAMANSTPFTPEGLPAEAARVIDKNRVTHQLVSNRMGQYLNKESNGITGNFILSPGSLTKGELIESVDECLEILSFSSLLINPRTLTWSSEIKLAKLHKKGEPVRMVKGGVASGSIRENFAGCRFSMKQIVRNAVADSWHPSIGYRGPDAMLVRSGVKIAGE